MPETDSSLTTIDYGDLAVLAASALGDTTYGVWTLAQLKEWILQAAQEYSNHFQYLNWNLITCTAGVYEYNLSSDTYQVLRAEHPVGLDPPAYLSFFLHTRPDFHDTDDRYDASINGLQTEAKIWISRTPAAGDYIHVLYSRYVWSPSGAGYTIRVRQAHYPILIQYAVWRAYHERWQAALIENLTISYEEMLDPEYPLQKRKAYEDMLTQAKAQVGKSDTVRWEMSDVDVIY